MLSFCKSLVVCALFAGPLSAAVITINADNYQSEVLSSKIPVILDAYTDWCPHCKNVAPLFAELSKEMEGKIKFAKIDIESEHSVANGLKIEALPTFLFYRNGKIVGRQLGPLDKNEFKAKFAKYFGG